MIMNKEFVVIVKTTIIIGDTNIVSKKAKTFPADTKISEVYKWIDTIPNAFGNVELLELE